jgi:hypothetical protein
MKRATLSRRIKQPNGWIAAGDEFRRASRSLSDGAFKLFVHLALEADRRTGCVQATYKSLAAELKKSKRAVGTYSVELSEKKICNIRPGENQYCKTAFEISDSYWPYEREAHFTSCEPNSYVAAVRTLYLSLGCTKARFSPGDARKAQELERQGVPLEILEAAMLLGACRKYSSWLDDRDSEPIGSLAYFGNIVAEIQQQPLPQQYKEYLRTKSVKLAEAWSNKLGRSHSQEKKSDERSGPAKGKVLAQNSNQQNGKKETR